VSAPKVDVLAVMDVRCHLGVKQSTKNANAAFLDWREWCNYLAEADKARAAVAELVNATRRALAYSDHICDTEHGGKRTPEALEHYNRMQAALDRIGGAA
jgi:hypothetical protein